MKTCFKFLSLLVMGIGVVVPIKIQKVQAQSLPSALPVIPRELTPDQVLEDPQTLIRQQQKPPVLLPQDESKGESKGELPSTSPTLPPIAGTFRVKQFVLIGSRVFSQTEIDRVTKAFTDRPITFADVLQARSLITELYVNQGYITTGAYIPEQDFQDGGDVQVTIIEGGLESIEIQGNTRLNTGYLGSRIANAGKAPLNREQLLEGLQRLRLNPLLSNLSATLEAGTRPGKSILTVKVQEAPSFDAQFSVNNNRSPSVGSFKRGLQLSEGNLFGFGDSFNVGYNNTKGSNSWDLGYSLPISPQETTLSLNLGASTSDVIEKPFNLLEIESKSRYYELTLRQPLQRRTTSEIAVGLTFSRRESETSLGFEDIGPFPLSPGADDRGSTRVSALRFFQELTKRSDRQVLAFRSQFSLGLNTFDATRNGGTIPDSQFFSWRGQAQWVKLIGNDPESLLLLRAEAQFANRSLLSGEQFGIGGVDSVRGYRQDALLTDGGLFGSAEVRLPIARIPSWNSTISLAPFLEWGRGWNQGRENPEVSTLFAGGLGLRWRVGNKLTARLDWGIPFRAIKSSTTSSLQENGLYFALSWKPF